MIICPNCQVRGTLFDHAEGLRHSAGGTAQTDAGLALDAQIFQQLVRQLLAGDGERHAVRLGMRMVRGLTTADAAKITAARADHPFDSVDDMWRRSGVPAASLVELAEAVPGVASATVGDTADELTQVRVVLEPEPGSDEARQTIRDLRTAFEGLDMTVVGGTEGVIHPLPLNAFAQMQALSRRNDDPERASRTGVRRWNRTPRVCEPPMSRPTRCVLTGLLGDLDLAHLFPADCN